MRWRHSLSGREIVRELHGKGTAVWALEVSERSVPIRRVAFPQPVAVVFGHEVAGVSPDLLREADGIVEIPLYGRKNSLNVATTFGIVVFEILRQWGY